MRNTPLLVNILLLGIIISTAFATGFLAHEFLFPTENNFVILQEAQNILKNHALEDLPPEPSLEYGMIHGMLQAYGDPHTRFVEPAQTELNNDDLEGSYGGIGASLDKDPEGFVILHPFPEGPATEAGIIDGDRLILVDDLELSPEIELNQVEAALRGPVGDPVSLRISRPPTYQPLDFKIKRQSIPLPSVTWYLAPADTTLGIIKINLIAASTADEIISAVEALDAKKATHYALDLRGNGGGLLTAGADIARLFLESGEVLSERYRDKEPETYAVRKPGPLTDIPLVVLINDSTASAAEIVAGALQAHGRAVLIGQPTFGKDSIQLAFDLSDGSSIHVTAAKWWIPGLEINIAEIGLQPDLLVSQIEGEPDAYIESAVQYFNEQ